MKEEFPVGQPEDVEDFKNFLNSLDFFVSFFIKEKRKRSKYSLQITISRTSSQRPCFRPLRTIKIHSPALIFCFFFHQGKKKAKEKNHAALPAPIKSLAPALSAFEKIRRNPNIAGRRATGCLTTEFKNVSIHLTIIKRCARTFLNEGGVSGWLARRC
jgi:hypothetical protein